MMHDMSGHENNLQDAHLDALQTQSKLVTRVVFTRLERLKTAIYINRSR